MIVRDDVPSIIPDESRPRALGHVHVHGHGFPLLREGVDEYYALRSLLEELYGF